MRSYRVQLNLNAVARVIIVEHIVELVLHSLQISRSIVRTLILIVDAL